MSDFEFRKDKLVLYVEEELYSDEDDNETEIDHRCYILYDQYEKEFFIVGKRNLDESQEFKFYTKKIMDVFNFLNVIIDSTSKINLYLFNFSNIYKNAPVFDCLSYLDFETLEDKSEEPGVVLSSFQDSEDCCVKEKIPVLLKMLKTIRY